MTNIEINEFQEQLNIAKLDPNHTGIKQLVLENDTISFKPVSVSYTHLTLPTTPYV